MPMSQDELNDQIEQRLEQGVPRPDVVKEMKQIGLEGDPWADFERMVAEFPERRAVEQMRHWILALRFGWSALVVWALLGELDLLLSVVSTTMANEPLLRGASTGALGVLLFGLVFRFGLPVTASMRHQRFALGTMVMLGVLMKNKPEDLMSAVPLLLVLGLGFAVKAKIYPHLSIVLGQLRS